MNHFKQYVLWYTLLPVLMFSIGSSYYRFVVKHDYVVSFHAVCDPYTQSCFVDCGDEEVAGACDHPSYYLKVTRHAAALLHTCGDKKVSQCESAAVCGLDEVPCDMRYCETGEDCETLTSTDQPASSEVEPGVEPILPLGDIKSSELTM